MKDLKENENIACTHIDKTEKIVVLDKKDNNNNNNKWKKCLLKWNLKLRRSINKILQDKVENIMKEGKWPENKILVNRNHAPYAPRAFLQVQRFTMYANNS